MSINLEKTKKQSVTGRWSGRVIRLERTVSEETYIKLIVNQKQFGCLGASLKPFTMTEREAIIATLEKRGWVDYNTVNVITFEGERIARINLEKYAK